MKILTTDEILGYLDKIRRIPRLNRHPNFSDLAEYTGLHFYYLVKLPVLRSRIGKTNRILLSKAIAHFGEPQWIEKHKFERKRLNKQNNWHIRIELRLEV